MHAIIGATWKNRTFIVFLSDYHTAKADKAK